MSAEHVIVIEQETGSHEMFSQQVKGAHGVILALEGKLLQIRNFKYKLLLILYHFVTNQSLRNPHTSS